MLQSLKLLWKFYYCDWKKRRLRQKILTPVATFLLIFFLFAFLAYYTVQIYYQTAAFQYSTYDVDLHNSTERQLDEIAAYDCVEHLVAYTSTPVIPLEHEGNTGGADVYAINSDTLCDLDYTPWHPTFAVERDDAIMADSTKNPIALSESTAVELNVKVGDTVIATLSDVGTAPETVQDQMDAMTNPTGNTATNTIEYTVAAIYQDVEIWSAGGRAYVLSRGRFLEWLLALERKNGVEVTEGYVPGEHAYVTFNDEEKGKEFLKNYVSDIDLAEKYGENWKEVATEAEMERYLGDYVTRAEALQTFKDNGMYQYDSTIWLLLLSCLALALFIFWERNKTVTLTIKPLTVLVAQGCSKAGLFTYFFGSTFLRQLWYFALTIPIIQYPLMQSISYSVRIYHFSGFLLLQCLPYVLGLLFAVSLATGFYLYVKFSRQLVLFTGDE